MQINEEIIHDFIFCQYKAFLKSRQQKGILSDYQTLYNKLKQNQKSRFEKTLLEKKTLISNNSTYATNIQKEGISLNLKFTNTNINLIFDGIEFINNNSIIPIFITPFENITKFDKQFIVLKSYYIKNEFNINVDSCKVIHGKFLKQAKYKFSISLRNFKKSIDDLNRIINDSLEPSLVLNNHCLVCEYSSVCMEKAKADDNLSLLDRATTKIIEKYKKKGIFTIQQLSYQYKPRRRRKHRAKQPISHNLELQALAIRTDKILVQSLPELLRQPIELFLDIEGNPDLKSYYLIGLLVAENQETISYSYWADKTTDEVHIWQQFLSKINEYPDSNIFHYGNYDSKSIETLGERYNTSVKHIQSRLINISNSVFGKIYFPIYSNRLKDLGNYIGASWSSKNASGIQSLVWRNLWEETQDQGLKQVLITYNLEDCLALKYLTDKLSQIQESSCILPEIDFVSNPKKSSSPESFQIHKQFDTILKFAHENYDSSKISFQSNRQYDDLSENKVQSN